MRRGGKTLKDQDKRNSGQKDEVVKIGWYDFGFWRSDFLKIVRV
jgi:hypothetical protein